MNPQLVFGIGGAVAGVWGLIIAVFPRWAQKLSGDELANGRPITPRFVRVIGVFLAVMGTVFVVAALTGFLPSRG